MAICPKCGAEIDHLDYQRTLVEWGRMWESPNYAYDAEGEDIEHEVFECPICGNKFSIDEMEADHIIPWSKGGKITIDNCQILCMKDNRIKSGK